MPAQSAAAAVRNADLHAVPNDRPAHGVQRRLNSDAVRAADEAHLSAALGSVSWRRRGFLQTLSRR